MTPCFEETGTTPSTSAAMATCRRILHFVDGLVRMLGAAFSLAVYGWMRNSPSQHFYWPAVVSVFAIASTGLHVLAYAVAGKHYRTTPKPADTICSDKLAQQAVLDRVPE